MKVHSNDKAGRSEPCKMQSHFFPCNYPASVFENLSLERQLQWSPTCRDTLGLRRTWEQVEIIRSSRSWKRRPTLCFPSRQACFADSPMGTCSELSTMSESRQNHCRHPPRAQEPGAGGLRMHINTVTGCCVEVSPACLGIGTLAAEEGKELLLPSPWVASTGVGRTRSPGSIGGTGKVAPALVYPCTETGVIPARLSQLLYLKRQALPFWTSITSTRPNSHSMHPNPLSEYPHSPLSATVVSSREHICTVLAIS